MFRTAVTITIVIAAIILAVALLRIAIHGDAAFAGTTEMYVINDIVVEYVEDPSHTDAHATIISLAGLEQDLYSPACHMFLGIAIATVAVHDAMQTTGSEDLSVFGLFITEEFYDISRNNCLLAL